MFHLKGYTTVVYVPKLLKTTNECVNIGWVWIMLSGVLVPWEPKLRMHSLEILNDIICVKFSTGLHLNPQSLICSTTL